MEQRVRQSDAESFVNIGVYYGHFFKKAVTLSLSPLLSSGVGSLQRNGFGKES